MRFLVEWRLLLLVGVGALAGMWAAVARQRRRHVLRFTNVELLDVVAPREPGWRRHVPPVIFLVALAALVLGFARPVRATRVADERATVVLAVDTIAFGTPDGVIDDPLGGTTPVPVAPGPLADIAAATGGTAFEAGSLGELSAVYADIDRVVGHDEVDRDASGWFVGAGIALLAVAASLSLLWFQRLP